MVTAIARPRIRRRVYSPPPASVPQLSLWVGELARDADDALSNHAADLDSLLTRVTDLEANPVGGGGSVSFGPPGTILPDDAAAEGVAATAARSDHTHAIAAAAAGAATPGDSAAEGAATSFARSDHKHALPAFGSAAATFCEGNDARLSNARTPTAHASTHSSGSSDPISHDNLAGLTTGDPHTQYIKVDGTRAWTGNQAAGGKKLTGLAAGTTAGDSVRYEQLGCLNIYDGRVIPAGLHSHSDEFSSNSIASWNDWDPGGFFSAAIDTTMRHFRFDTPGTPAGATRYGGYYKAVPSNTFTFLAYVASHQIAASQAAALGLLLAQDLAGAPSTSDLISNDFVPQRSGSNGAASARFAADYLSAGTIASRPVTGPTGIWLRCRVTISGSTTTVGCDWSTDGVYWTEHQTITRSYAALHYGIFFGHASSAAGAAVAKHFRVFDATASFDAGPNGGYLAA